MSRWISISAAVLLSCGGQTGSGTGDAGAGAAGTGAVTAGGSGGGGGLPTGGTSSGGTSSGGGIGASGGVAGGGGTSACTWGFAGTYFFALGLVLDPTRPVVALVSIDAKDNAGTLESSWSIQPLLWSDRKTPVGSPILLPTITHTPSGAFDTDPPVINLPGEANPFSHTAVTVELNSIKGSLCGADAFSCGTTDGDLTKPIPYDLKGSTWTLTKVSGPASYPEPPPVDCKMTPAVPVDQL